MLSFFVINTRHYQSSNRNIKQVREDFAQKKGTKPTNAECFLSDCALEIIFDTFLYFLVSSFIRETWLEGGDQELPSQKMRVVPQERFFSFCSRISPK